MMNFLQPTPKQKFWDYGFILFLVCILIFGLSRARHDLRWSAWASADADTLNAALHFAKEGFLEYYLMPYIHPGYLGKGAGDFNPVNTTGYNIRYPSFCVILDGMFIRIFGENRVVLKSIAVLFAVCAILFSYLTFQFFFTKPVAFFSSLFMGSSVCFLQLIDSPTLYIYSEFFRFAILFFFLLSEKMRNVPWKFFFLSAMVWLLLFVEAFNSFDYYIFLQLFFWLYYWLSEKKLPILRLCFLASAPLLSFFTHKILATLLLKEYGISATKQLLIGFFEKTLPFHKGFMAVVQSIPYFMRMMEENMVQDNFGFGFGVVFLMCAVVLLLHFYHKENFTSFFTRSEVWNLNKILILFFLPSISWWVIFPNHTVTFFYTPIHAVALIGLLISLSFLFSFQILLKAATPIPQKVALLTVIAGVSWSHFLNTTKYLKEYPNLMDTTVRDFIGIHKGLSSNKIAEFISLFKELGKVTSYGDIIVSVPHFISMGSIEEYYAQRRIDFLTNDSIEELKEKMEELKKYRKEGGRIYKRFDPNLKIFVLTERKDHSEIHHYCKKNYKLYKEPGKEWLLYTTD